MSKSSKYKKGILPEIEKLINLCIINFITTVATKNDTAILSSLETAT